MPGNYLTSHPVFQMLNKEKDFVSIEYGLNEEDSREEFYKKIETRLNKLEFINQTKKKVNLHKMIEFLSYFIHPNGSVGGEYGSRSTTFFVPYGFAQNHGLSENVFPLHGVRALQTLV